MGQKYLGPRLAAMHKIPLVFYGEDEAEYGNPVADTSTAERDYSYFSSSDKSKNNIVGTSLQELNDYFGVTNGDLYQYMPVDPDLIKKEKVEVHYLGYYLKWHPQSCYYYAIENGGFTASPERTPEHIVNIIVLMIGLMTSIFIHILQNSELEELLMMLLKKFEVETSQEKKA